MATSGTGRGRGWLNINKNVPNKPAAGLPTSGILNTTKLEIQSHSLNPDLFDSGACPQPYTKLISLINQLNNMDDGILMNQKFKIINETWASDCPTSNQVEDSFNYIYQKCLEDEIFAMKVVTMIASNTYSKVEISEQKIRRLFIGHLQHTYENNKQLQTSNPSSFRIGVRMLSEYFNKGRLTTGRHLTVLASPLLCYLDMLLESGQPADIQLFTSQLHINGSVLKAQYPQQLNDILNKVRQVLICNLQLTQMSKLFLLLAIDLANNRFGILPQDVLKFYQEELGDKIMTDFQVSLGALSIQTQLPSKTLDSYQSNVSVLQVTPPDSTSPTGDSPSVLTKNLQSQHQASQQSNTSNTTQNIHTNSQSFGNNTSTTYNNDSALNLGGWEAKKEKTSVPNREKTGRPILGVGARLQKDKQDSSVNWRDHHKDNSSNWGKEKNNGSGWNDKKTKTYNKGWEHDDRFETDYQ